MLGGSAAIAVLRYIISLGGTVLLFSLMSEPRLERKKAAVCYACFSVVLIAAAGFWYVVNWESCVKVSAFAMYVCFCCFAFYMSKDSVFLTIYKLTLNFYLLAVFLIVGIEVAIIFFDRNLWADIVTRVILIFLIALFIEKKIKSVIRSEEHTSELQSPS